MAFCYHDYLSGFGHPFFGSMIQHVPKIETHNPIWEKNVMPLLFFRHDFFSNGQFSDEKPKTQFFFLLTQFDSHK